MKDKNIFIFAGETSADLYSAMLLVELEKRLPTHHFWGVAGPSSRYAIEAFLPMETFQVMGISDVIKAFPRLFRAFCKLKKEILKRMPEMVIIIDQPSFGMKLAKALRKKGYKGKIVQFVAPTVWAWKPERADDMAKYFDLLLTLFDFEPAYFAHTKLKTVFVGHPIYELLENDHGQSLSLDPERPVLAIFPGSRPQEVKRNLKKQLEAAKIYTEKHPATQICVCTTENLPQNIIKVPFNARYELMKKAHLAIAKSGTVTLELALHAVPTVVTYELSKLNRFMARHVMKLDKMAHFSIVNILAKKELFIEKIRPPVAPQDIAAALEQLDHAACKQGCLELKNHVVGEVSAIKRAAKEICEIL